MGLDFANRFAKYEVDTVKTRKGLDLDFMVSQGLGGQLRESPAIAQPKRIFKL